jgi:hypothetical protein
MGPVRRAINLACALALTGTYLLFDIVLTVYQQGGFRGRIVMAAVLMTVLGGYWLWVDFIKATPTEEG